MIESNGDSPGVIKIGFVDSRGVIGDGTLITLTFNVVGKNGATSMITPQVTTGGFFYSGRKNPPINCHGRGGSLLRIHVGYLPVKENARKNCEIV